MVPEAIQRQTGNCGMESRSPSMQIPEKQVPENPSQIKKVTGASITTGQFWTC
jgi:hypothetical protein